MSEHRFHESYVGYNALIDYLQTYNNKSYRSFLELNRDIIISSLTAVCDWNDLDNSWATRFLYEAKKLGTTLDQKVKYERSGKWLMPYWKGIIEQHKRTQLKSFAYKIIYYETPEQIPEENQKSDLCGICHEELLPQLTENIAILTCAHLFHWKCLGHTSLEPSCPFCSEEHESTKKWAIDNSDERYEYDNHNNDYYDNDHGISLEEHSFDHDNGNHHIDNQDNSEIQAPVSDDVDHLLNNNNNNTFFNVDGGPIQRKKGKRVNHDNNDNDDDNSNNSKSDDNDSDDDENNNNNNNNDNNSGASGIKPHNNSNNNINNNNNSNNNNSGASAIKAHNTTSSSSPSSPSSSPAIATTPPPPYNLRSKRKNKYDHERVTKKRRKKKSSSQQPPSPSRQPLPSRQPPPSRQPSPSRHSLYDNFNLLEDNNYDFDGGDDDDNNNNNNNNNTPSCIKCSIHCPR
ncbi:hypothetical protein Glove_115g106 [Diversispora epigaea]|uniref:RING-type domain-containing protein n=1 Tax=Diversispora epigaea TaxID=1348612 RepID=A0A397J9Z5_9GLOM|nr:hypothetical protein Glove_115g106 [Diversispora epigaea]